MYYQHIGKAKIRQEGRLTTAIKCSDESLYISNTHFNGDTEVVVGAVPYGLNVLMETMDGVFNMFLSDADATFAAVNELEPLHLNEYCSE